MTNITEAPERYQPIYHAAAAIAAMSGVEVDADGHSVLVGIAGYAADDTTVFLVDPVGAAEEGIGDQAGWVVTIQNDTSMDQNNVQGLTAGEALAEFEKAITKIA